MNTVATLVVLAFALGFVFALVVARDARKNRIPTYGDDYTVNTGAIAWFLGAVIVPFLVVPAYFFRRHRVVRLRALPSPQQEPVPDDVLIRCEFDLDLHETRRATKAQFHSAIGDRDRLWTTYITYGGLALGSLAYGVFGGFHWAQLAIGLPAFVLFVYFLIWPRVMAHLTFKGRSESSIRTLWEISSEQLSVQSVDLATAEVQWKAYASAHLNRDGVLLKLYNNAYSWFPKCGFGSEDEFRLFLDLLVEKGLLKQSDRPKP